MSTGAGAGAGACQLATRCRVHQVGHEGLHGEGQDIFVHLLHYLHPAVAREGGHQERHLLSFPSAQEPPGSPNPPQDVPELGDGPQGGLCSEEKV